MIGCLVTSQEISQIDMPVLGHFDGHEGKRKPNFIEDVGAAKHRDGLKIDEELLEANERGLVGFLDFELRHFKRQYERIEFDLFDRDRVLQFLRCGWQDIRLDNVGDKKETDEGVDEEKGECRDRERDRTKEPTHGASNRRLVKIFIFSYSRLLIPP